jgi:hypothetical protein
MEEGGNSVDIFLLSFTVLTVSSLLNSIGFDDGSDGSCEEGGRLLSLPIEGFIVFVEISADFS